ncbi:MAG TPA: hypothetical protein VEV82_11445 [Actinomycetota bacterium]|nr:hypothetical protein [Actinomycetota bacterium]
MLYQLSYLARWFRRCGIEARDHLDDPEDSARDRLDDPEDSERIATSDPNAVC